MHPMVTYQEVIGGDHSNNGEMNSRAVALSEGSIYYKKFAVILLFLMHNVMSTLAFERCIKLFHLLEELI